MWRDLLATDIEQAKISIFGIAVDENCSIGRGAALAPKVMRECSEFLPPHTAKGEKISPILWDMGDVTEYDYEQVFAIMQSVQDKKYTIVLGGDHSVGILSQKAFRALHPGKVGLIHIDAHADICDVYMNSKISHACVNRRALDNGYLLEDLALIGIRSFESQEVDFLQSNAVLVRRADEIEERGVGAIVQELCDKYQGYDAIYLSFDIDSVDPAYAPGTGTPEPFGLTNLTVLRILKELIERLPIKAMDVVEISPPLDINNITTWLALKYLLEIIKIIEKK